MKPPSRDKLAPDFDKLAFCAYEDTASYLDAMGLTGGETVLNLNCSVGCMSVAAAKKGCQVTGVDSSAAMLEFAKENAATYGVADRCEFRQLDWKCILVGQNLAKADVVLSTRGQGADDIEKLSSLANKTVMLQMTSDAPSICELKKVLFSGCGKPGAPKPERKEAEALKAPDASVAKKPEGGPRPSMPPAPGGPADPCAPKGPRHVWPPRDSGYRAGCAYLDAVLRVYAAGYNPNVRIMPERFVKDFATKDEAIDWVVSLAPKHFAEQRDRIALNADPFITPVDGGVRFEIASEAAVIWWDVK